MTTSKSAAQRKHDQEVADAAIAFSGGAAVLRHGGGDKNVGPGHLIVVCRRPGFRRAGIEHKAFEIYPDGELSNDQVRAISADPLFEVIRVL